MPCRLLYILVLLIFIIPFKLFLGLLPICELPVIFSLSFKSFSVLSALHRSIMFQEPRPKTKPAWKKGLPGGDLSLFSVSVNFPLWGPALVLSWTSVLFPSSLRSNQPLRHRWFTVSQKPFLEHQQTRTHTKRSFVLPLASYISRCHHSVSNSFLFTRQCLVPWDCW